MRTLLVAAAVLASWLTTPAHADPAPSDAEATASALVADAARAYDQNQLDEALRLLTRAYELSPRPSILYNQAQVLRTKNDCAAALDAYDRFIATTTASDPNRERAVHRRAEMQTCAEQQRPAAAAEQPPATTSPAASASAAAPNAVQLAITERPPTEQAAPAVAAPTITTSAAEDSARGRRRTMRIAGWALVGVGVLAASAAAAYAWEAHDIQEELNAKAQFPLSRYQEGERDATRARWFGAAAALAGAGGATLLIVARPPGASADAPGNTGPRAAALVEWTGTF